MPKAHVLFVITKVLNSPLVEARRRHLLPTTAQKASTTNHGGADFYDKKKLVYNSCVAGKTPATASGFRGLSLVRNGEDLQRNEMFMNQNNKYKYKIPRLRLCCFTRRKVF